MRVRTFVQCSCVGNNFIDWRRIGRVRSMQSPQAVWTLMNFGMTQNVSVAARLWRRMNNIHTSPRHLSIAASPLCGTIQLANRFRALSPSCHVRSLCASLLAVSNSNKTCFTSWYTIFPCALTVSSDPHSGAHSSRLHGISITSKKHAVPSKATESVMNSTSIQLVINISRHTC